MTPRKALSAALLALALTGCSGVSNPSGTTPALHEALGTMGGAAGGATIALQFHDVQGIRDTIGSDGTIEYTTDELATMDEREKWDHTIGRTPLQAAQLSPDSPEVVTQPHSISWTAVGLASSQAFILAGASDSYETARQNLTNAGWEETEGVWTNSDHQSPLVHGTRYRLADENIYIEQNASKEELSPGAADSALADERITAILDCLGDPAAAYLLAREDRAYAVAAAVDEDGHGTAWSCIYAPGHAESVAAELTPSQEFVRIISSEVDGEVIRTELEVTPLSLGIPAALQLIQHAPETPIPGF